MTLSEHKEGMRIPRKPLLIGCSGGGGHNSAIKAIAQWYMAQEYQLTTYDPVKSDDDRIERIQDSPQYKKIMSGLSWSYGEYLGRFIRWLLPKTPFPLLPTPNSIETEVDKLSTNNKEKPYVDMLLEVYPSGYENAAIWNCLQKNDKIDELNKLITFQEQNDKENYDEVYEYFTNMLENAREDREPYTEIVSTQAMSLPALCDAVKDYNERHKHNDLVEPVLIKQYMTDLPTKGAVHYFESLSRLSDDQRAQMQLFGVDFSEEIQQEFGLDEPPFASIKNIHPAENPMVRDGFKNIERLSSYSPEESISFEEAGKCASTS